MSCSLREFLWASTFLWSSSILHLSCSTSLLGLLGTRLSTSPTSQAETLTIDGQGPEAPSLSSSSWLNHLETMSIVVMGGRAVASTLGTPNVVFT